MKCNSWRGAMAVWKSPPVRGAWVEISLLFPVSATKSVAPCAGGVG